MFKRSEQMKKSVKNFLRRGNFTPFMSKSFQTWDHFFPLFSPKDSENLKFLTLDFMKWGQKTFKRSEKNEEKNP